MPTATATKTPSRALVPALSLTLLISWGSLYYSFAIWVRPMQDELPWSGTAAMGAYSTALVVWGLCAYPAGRLMDRHGGRLLMVLGSCGCALLFAALSQVHTLWAFYLVWAGLGACMALVLYEPAFAVIVAAWPHDYRRRIGMLTLTGGLASTVFWPLTHGLVAVLGWRHTLLVYAATHFLVCVPLHWFLVPRLGPGARAGLSLGPPKVAPPAPRSALASPVFWMLALAFAAFGFVTSAMAMYVVPMLEATGLTPAAAIAVAALIGPMQVAGRSADLLLANRLQPRTVGMVTVALIPVALLVLWVAPGALPAVYFFAVIYGAGLGLLTIVRAAAPVAIFGAAGYASISGALSGSSVLARAAGPMAGALVMAHHGYTTLVLVLMVFAAGGACAYWGAVLRRSP